jgi:hypothetical protein
MRMSQRFVTVTVAAFAMALLIFSGSCAHDHLDRPYPDQGYGDSDPGVQKRAVAVCCTGGRICRKTSDGVVIGGVGSEPGTCRFVANTSAGRNACIEKGGTVYLCAEVGTTCDSSGCTCKGGRCGPGPIK